MGPTVMPRMPGRPASCQPSVPGGSACQACALLVQQRRVKNKALTPAPLPRGEGKELEYVLQPRILRERSREKGLGSIAAGVGRTLGSSNLATHARSILPLALGERGRGEGPKR